MLHILFCLTLLCSFPLSVHAAEIRVMGAASLKGVISEVATSFEQSNPEHRIVISTASSGTLARQIAAGAPADLFLSANPRWMSHLVEKEKIGTERPANWASNHLVVIGRDKSISTLDDLTRLKRIAIGSPESAPVGRYARELLQRAGLYQKLEQNQQLVLAKDVWQVLLYAEQGAVDAAILYASDSLLCEKSMRLLVPDAQLQPVIIYPIALTRAGEQKAAARDFFKYLQHTASSDILIRYGFEPLFYSGKD
ncbi:MAG TPA: molybdate ABC transporter substrate-binding protein [Geopsychrobacteraceae bacterium]|nr:molybdate ABC transporter substrate-binding protein [Geopsychrobacteraceae bacterium]